MSVAAALPKLTRVNLCSDLLRWTRAGKKTLAVFVHAHFVLHIDTHVWNTTVVFAG
eukprot:COSAG06_NODE_112_length_23474_cov_81.804458_33_plen_56_part_00